MYPFRYERARDLGQLGGGGAGAEFLGGGTDLMQLMKDDVRRPERIVDIRPGAELVTQSTDVFVATDGTLYVTDTNGGLSILAYEG